MNARVFLPRLMLLLLAAVALALPACNTMSGAGRDISSAGQCLECSAEKNK